MESAFEKWLSQSGNKVVQTKYQSVRLTIDAASPAGIYNAKKELDSNYNVCDGVQITELTDGGIANGDYDVSISNNNGTPIELSPVQAHATTKNDGSNPNERYVDTLFDCKSGKDVKLEAETFAAPGTDMVIKATFRLRKLLNPVSLPKN